jgi:hypothetical protein
MGKQVEALQHLFMEAGTARRPWWMSWEDEIITLVMETAKKSH